MYWKVTTKDYDKLVRAPQRIGLFKSTAPVFEGVKGFSRVVEAISKKDAIRKLLLDEEAKKANFNPRAVVDVSPLRENALVVDSKHGWSLEFVDDAKLPENHTVYYFYGDKEKEPLPVSFILRDNDGVLTPYVSPKEIKTPPSLLYSLIDWGEAQYLFKAPSTKSYKGVSLGLMIAFVIILILGIVVVLG